MRSYFRLLRLPYQLQLAPIFGWGYLLANGDFASTRQVLHCVTVFLLFHIGAFGGLTALNSFYDRDSGPVGGLWHPPPAPHRLRAFAWLVQGTGFILLLPLDQRLAALYAAIVLLALGYSHPHTRWKGNPWASVLVVALGQGVLDYAAGALTSFHVQPNPALWCGLCGATLTVIGYYPLTQLYQIESDVERGDRTTAAVLMRWRGRPAVLAWAGAFLTMGACFNALALAFLHRPIDSGVFPVTALALLIYLNRYRNTPASTLADFRMVHALMRCTALLFGCYILGRLVWASRG